MHTPFILNTVQRALQATTDVMPTKFYLDPDYDLIQFEEGYDKPPREVFYAKYNELLNTHKYKVFRVSTHTHTNTYTISFLVKIINR